MEALLPWVPALLVGALSLFLQGRSLAARVRARLLVDLPRVQAAAVSVGLFEVAGRAASEAPERSRLSQTEAVLHRWSIAEQFRRVVVETTRGPNGRMQTRQRVESGWQRIAGDSSLRPFLVRDASGAVRVAPEGARLELERFLLETFDRSDPRYDQFVDLDGIPNSTGRRRWRDEGLSVGAEVFVVGRARWGTGDEAPEFAEDPESPLFEISVRGEDAVRARHRSAGRWSQVFGLLFCALAGWLLLRAAAGAGVATGLEPWVGAVGGALVGLLFQLGGWCLVTHNAAVDLSKRVDRAASTIDIELQRRADLLPRLVACVDAERTHERDVQAALAALRGAVGQTSEGAPGADPEAVADRLAVVLEAYPELDSDASFRELSEALVRCEDRIARSRATFNDFAASFNTRRERFPEGWIVARVRPGKVDLRDERAFRVRPEVALA